LTTPWNNLSLLELIIEEPDVVEFFKYLLLQLSWEYNQIVEVPK